MRRRSRTGFVAGGLLLAAPALAAPNAPLLKVTLVPSEMDAVTNKGEVKVSISVPGIDAPAGAPLIDAPPAGLTIADDQGPVLRNAADGGGEDGGEQRSAFDGGSESGRRARSWSPARPVKGTLTITYTASVSNTPTNGGTTPIFPRIDGEGFSALGMTLLAIPKVKGPYRIGIDWDLKAMGPGATAVSSAGDGNAEMPAGPVSRLRFTAFMAGKLMRDPPVAGTGNFSAAWSGDPGFDLHPPMQWAAKLHAYMMQFFDTPHDPAYRVFLRLNGARNPGGGVAFPNSFFATYGPGVTGENMKQILGHEMTHTFTANDLGKWYDEGNAVFYQVRLPWRAGMVSTEAYLKDINLTAARYYTNAEIDAPEARVIPNFFKDPWMTILSYDRGMLYFAALDGKIRRASRGKRSVDDLVRTLVHKKRDGHDIVETDWTDLLRNEIGEEGLAIHRSMLAGGTVIPESGDFGPCFRRFSTQIRRYEMGFTARPGPGTSKIVADLVAGTEAAKAGFHNGDSIVLPVITTEGVKRDPAATMTVQVTRAGKTFPITYLPRGAAVAAYQWERVPGVPDRACRP